MNSTTTSDRLESPSPQASVGNRIRPVARRGRLALVSSGLGPAFGGMGVVSEMIVDALEPDVRVTVWRHHHRWHRALRIPALGARAALGALGRPEFVFYEHVDLARMHALIPVLRSIPYGVLMCGIDVWKPLSPRHRAAILGARLIVSISATTAQLARQENPWLPEPSVIWLGVRPDRSDPVAARPPVALIVGRMAASERYKGHDPILDAWPEVRRAVPEARLIVVGSGDDLPRLRQRVESESLGGVEFRGWISDQERAELYRTSRLFLFPSQREGFGLAPVEAAAAGTPVLGLRGTVIEELFPEGTGVVLVDEPTGPQIAAAAIPLLADPARASTLGQVARDRVNAMFLEEHFAARFRAAIAPFLSGTERS